MASTSVAVFLVLTVVLVSGQDYCKVCRTHTMCKYKGDGPACKNKLASGMTQGEKDAVLKAHNIFRSYVASGRAPGQPPAANMMKLVWDDKLAAVAQRWADQCIPAHDACRNDPRFRVGQNIYETNDDDDNMTAWKKATRAWYDEVKLFNAANISPFKGTPDIGHYSQLVWADTKFIGCGFSSIEDQKMYVCNYGRTGNVKRGTMYKKGKACSMCPKGTKCKQTLCV